MAHDYLIFMEKEKRKMKEKMRKKSKFLVMFGCLILLCISFSINSEAASAYKKIYKNLLKKESCTYTSSSGHKVTVNFNYFTLLDIDRNGVPELITSEDTSLMYGDVFTVKNNRLRYLGDIFNKYHDGIRYNPKAKGLVLAEGGTGVSGETLWKIVNGKLKETLRIEASCRTSNKTIYYLNNKKCSAKTFRRYREKYFSKSKVKIAKVVKNNSTNRRKKLK